MEKNVIKNYVGTRVRKVTDKYTEVKTPQGNFVVEHLVEDRRKFIILQEDDFLPAK